MFEIVLYEPEIPPNTGNIMRLCANTGCRLHLVRPLGFSLTNKQLARAGMDYRSGIDYVVHDDWRRCVEELAAHRLFAVTTRGNQRYDRVGYQAGDAFVFGPETRGLPQSVLEDFAPGNRLVIPMAAASRSINLEPATSVGAVTFNTCAFVCDLDLRGQHFAVVNDVLTTGATLNELAHNLRRAGAIEIQGWVVARTLRQD